MDNAQLDMCLRINAVYCVREPFQSVHAGNQNVLKPPVFKLCQHTQPELRPFVFCQPHAQQFFLAFGVNTQSKEHGFVNHAAAVTNLHNNTVKINNGIQCIQRSILPLCHLFFNGIGDFTVKEIAE